MAQASTRRPNRPRDRQHAVLNNLTLTQRPPRTCDRQESARAKAYTHTLFQNFDPVVTNMRIPIRGGRVATRGYIDDRTLLCQQFTQAATRRRGACPQIHGNARRNGEVAFIDQLINK